MTLNQFLVKAKINTYAAAGEERERQLGDGGRELLFTEGDWKYRDRYFGSHTFIGQELVWKNEKLLWGMNYYGRVMSKIIDAEQIYTFLRDALKNVEERKPFRGPTSFKNKEWTYANEIAGATRSFRGHELIVYKNHQVFELHYHGGLITT